MGALNYDMLLFRFSLLKSCVLKQGPLRNSALLWLCHCHLLDGWLIRLAQARLTLVHELDDVIFERACARLCGPQFQLTWYSSPHVHIDFVVGQQ